MCSPAVAGVAVGIGEHAGGLELGGTLTDGWTLICAGKLLCRCMEGDCVLFPLFQRVQGHLIGKRLFSHVWFFRVFFEAWTVSDFFLAFKGFPKGAPWAESPKAVEQGCTDAVLYTCGVSNAIPPHATEQAVFHLPFQAITAFFFCF